MPVEAAVSIGFKTCKKIIHFIETNEEKWQEMDGRHRSELGAWRCLLFTAGVPKDQLPEVPFLDPAHLQTFKARQAEAKAKREAMA